MPTPFESLDVWQVSHRLALDVYRATAKFPVEERYGLTAQLRRAASAIHANIAEGNGRGSAREYAYFCRVAKGSASEVRYLLRLALDLGFIPKEKFEAYAEGCGRIGKMLHFLVSALSSSARE